MPLELVVPAAPPPPPEFAPAAPPPPPPVDVTDKRPPLIVAEELCPAFPAVSDTAPEPQPPTTYIFKTSHPAAGILKVYDPGLEYIVSVKENKGVPAITVTLPPISEVPTNFLNTGGATPV